VTFTGLVKLSFDRNATVAANSSDENPPSNQQTTDKEGRELAQNEDFYFCNFIQENQEYVDESQDFACELADFNESGISFNVTF
jgi:hypothetical protein